MNTNEPILCCLCGEESSGKSGGPLSEAGVELPLVPPPPPLSAPLLTGALLQQFVVVAVLPETTEAGRS